MTKPKYNPPPPTKFFPGWRRSCPCGGEKVKITHVYDAKERVLIVILPTGEEVCLLPKKP